MFKDINVSTIIKFILKLIPWIIFFLIILSNKIAIKKLQNGFFSNDYKKLKAKKQ